MTDTTLAWVIQQREEASKRYQRSSGEARARALGAYHAYNDVINRLSEDYDD